MVLRIIIPLLIGIFFIFFCIPFWMDAHKLEHSIQETKHIRYLSYIPNLEIGAVIEFKAPVSLKKIDFFKDDSFSESELYQPVIDKVLLLPPQFSSIRNNFIEKKIKVF